MLTDKDINQFILIMIFFMILFQMYTIILINKKKGECKYSLLKK
jgi:hypothetical protein